MKKIKLTLIGILCALAFMLSVTGFLSLMNGSKYSDSVSVARAAGETEKNSVSPRIFANISFGIGGGDGKVAATAKNNFNLFPSDVYVIIQLYYSYDYCTDPAQMTLAKTVSTDDLDMGQSITAEASTDGEERFWLAVLRYREDSGNWNERTVSARYSADGNYMGIT